MTRVSIIKFLINGVYCLPAPVTQFPKKESLIDQFSRTYIWRNNEGERIIAYNYAQLSFVGRLYNFIEPILFGFHVEKHIARQRDRT
jgi:hypothetical protein